MSGGSTPEGSAVAVSDLTVAEVGARLAGVEISRWFDPFLRPFARETIGSGGRAMAATDSGRVVGLLLTSPAERSASLFTRSRAVAEQLARLPTERTIYSELDLGGSKERFAIFDAEVRRTPPHRFRHSPRLLAASELPAVGELLREVYGAPVDAWLGIAFAEGERCFGVEIDGTLAGVAWLLVAGRWGRLHTLTVRPGFRRLGVGTDLLAARLLFARQAGVVRAISEISERNGPSTAVAERCGMRPAGELFLHLGDAAASRPGMPGGEFGTGLPRIA